LYFLLLNLRTLLGVEARRLTLGEQRSATSLSKIGMCAEAHQHIENFTATKVQKKVRTATPPKLFF